MADTRRRYRFLLFDVDDTLMDFQRIEAEALQKLFAFYGRRLTRDVLETYHAVNKRLWAQYECGGIPMREMLDKRFELTMAAFDVCVDGAAWEKTYQNMLGDGHYVIDGAAETLGRLVKAYRLFAVTNGVSETQRRRLEGAGLLRYFEAVFDSQSIGFQKPSKAFFDHVASRIGGFDARRALVIGDSLRTDIKGGVEAGIDTCWFNRHGAENSAGLPITYVITRLDELHEILGAPYEG